MKFDTKKFFAWFIVFVIIISGYFYSKTIQPEYDDFGDEQLVPGKVLSIEDSDIVQGLTNSSAQVVGVQITEGEYAGKSFETLHYKSGNLAFDFDVFEGDNVILSLEMEDKQVIGANIAYLNREKPLTNLFVVFFVSIILVGAWRGIKAILSLGLTGLGIVEILIPSILAGDDPVTVTIVVTAAVTVITFLLISGLNRKALAAILGTVLGTLTASLIAHLSISATRLSQLAIEEGGMLLSLPQSGIVNFQGLLLAGIIIGALGAVMDVAMSVSSTIHEVKTLNPELTSSKLIKSGLNVGRDVIGTMSNTLILAYTGGALPLILIIMGHQIPLVKVLNLDLFAIEIVRALAGSIGLFLAVPLTSLIGGLLYHNYLQRSNVVENKLNPPLQG